MKKILIIAAVAVAVSGCNSIKSANPFKKEQKVGMANPASEFCIKQGGQLEPKKSADGGEYALCYLPNGQVIEEWAYFRQHHAQD
ncbi:MAG: DUF333 domain-containing protein [Moraxella sp.]|nr:DUF333 domain-containing protein [Moraxella sp.]